MGTPADIKQVPQTNSYDNQTFAINPVDLFKDFVTGGTTQGNETNQNVAIDDLRSQINVSVTNQSTKNLLPSLNLGSASNNNTTSGTSNVTTPGQTVQESRCHAFYRIIGFPVVSQNQTQYY